MLAELIAPLKALHLDGMAQGLSELLAEPDRQPTLPEPWLTRLIEAEQTERQVRTLRSQRRVARFPMHRDLASFDFAESPLSEPCLQQLATAGFTATAHNLIFIGGTGTGKPHPIHYLYREQRIFRANRHHYRPPPPSLWAYSPADRDHE